MSCVRFDLTAVAFLQSAGGRMRVLFAIDRAGTPLFGGDPAVLVHHRPGGRAADLRVEGADVVPELFLEALSIAGAPALAALIDAAHDRSGAFHGDRLVGQAVSIELPAGAAYAIGT